METKPKRRKTLHHFDVPGEAHELTFSCYQRRPFLARDQTCQYLADAMNRARDLHQLHIWAYVFMPEHVHLLIWPTADSYSTAAILRSIKQPVARRATNFLRSYNPQGLTQLATGESRRPYRFWLAGAGYDRNVTSPKAARAILEYIHNNPVRRGLVAQPEEWKWSSARDWLEQGQGPVTVDRDSLYL